MVMAAARRYLLPSHNRLQNELSNVFFRRLSSEVKEERHKGVMDSFRCEPDRRSWKDSMRVRF